MSGTLAGVTSLGSEVVLYGKIDWLPNGDQNVRFLAGFSLTAVEFYCAALWRCGGRRVFLAEKRGEKTDLRTMPSYILQWDRSANVPLLVAKGSSVR